jgi:death-on-curing protein
VREPVWITRDFVLALHERLLADYGGQPGIRDGGLLESALARPRQVLAYDEPDIAALATAYASGIIRNHPFVDGNKRVGFMAAYVFLGLNGLELTAPEPEATRAVLDLAAGQSTDAQFAQWLRDHTERTA